MIILIAGVVVNFLAERREGRPEAGDADRVEIKENGVSETSTHDLTLSSVDITIDSVKDHLTK